ncbi:MAG TPA: class I SAM-dependent methyltransferase [Thermoanaerobaculia bacterium]|nr:class I SAM-dependent methyltransferase [Thermoanaerobaculia bacterium]
MTGPQRMTLAERLLLLVSRDPRQGAYPPLVQEGGESDPLALLRRVFPGRLDDLAGRRVLDFGCGGGAQVVALARAGAARVVGLEIKPEHVAEARRRADAAGVDGRVEIRSALGPADAGRFDLVLSQNAMEHFDDPRAVLADMTRALAPGGSILVTFGPPWYAPYGGHMHFFTRLPWATVLFGERTVMRVRARFRDDGATRYAELQEGLNRMSLAKFERLVAESGLAVIERRDDQVRGQRWLGRMPLLRELSTTQVSCVLARRAAGT